MYMGFVQTIPALLALRFLLGMFEAGVLPAILYLTSLYYKRHEFQKRTSAFFSSILAASAIGGLLEYAIAHLGGRNGYSAWRWTFIIEGAITVVVAVFASFLIVDWPEQNRYLGRREALARAKARSGRRRGLQSGHARRRGVEVDFHRLQDLD